MTEEKRKEYHSTYSLEEFEKAVRPLMEWINDNLHPHHVVIVDHTNAQVHESQMSFNTNDYLRD